jgi:thiosulfate dehydrogenase
MKHRISKIIRFIIGICVAGGLLLFSIWLVKIGYEGLQSPSKTYLDRKLAREHEAYQLLEFNLVDPSQAPLDIRSMARWGYQILIDTQKNAQEYCGNELNCTNCHFAGGNTTGGSQGGISLVGSATRYPMYDKRLQRVIDLEQRINNCFKRSMNGTPVPHDSELMLAMITYLQWISKNLPIYKPVPWLGLVPLQEKREGNVEQGERLYHVYCALCHRDDGKGGQDVPPVWGDGSFNDGAGMAGESTLASFIYWNMPYMDSTPVLSEEQAQDVAAYILTQPRPKFLSD